MVTGVLFSTKMTRGGQTTVPKEIRDALGIGDTDRVYWSFDGRRATLTAEPAAPLSVSSEEDFWSRVGEARESARAGRVGDAGAAGERLRAKHGL